MVYIENEGALFRGPARSNPAEVWSVAKGAFVPYKGSKEKPIDWGHEISEAEANELMEGDQAAGEEQPESSERARGARGDSLAPNVQAAAMPVAAGARTRERG